MLMENLQEATNLCKKIELLREELRHWISVRPLEHLRVKGKFHCSKVTMNVQEKMVDLAVDDLNSKIEEAKQELSKC